jgi:hypothetical protein
MQNQVCRLTPESLKGVNENCKKCLEFGGLKDFSVFWQSVDYGVKLTK